MHHRFDTDARADERGDDVARRVVPSRSTAKPGGASATVATPGNPTSTRFAASTSSTSKYAVRVPRAGELGDSARRDETPAVHHDEVAAHLFDFREQVARQQHGRAFAARLRSTAGGSTASLAGPDRPSARRAGALPAARAMHSATPSRWCMPSEYVFTLRSMAAPRPAMSSARSRPGGGQCAPAPSHHSFRLRIPDTYGTNAACSIIVPTRCNTGAPGWIRCPKIDADP